MKLEDGKKYQIFVSSTYTDLADLRRSIIDSILGIQHFPVGMESFVSSNNEQWDVITKTIEASDYYICIIGQRYGTINEKSKLSYTEMEWDYAKYLGIPIMTFIQNENVATKPSHRESKKSAIDSLIKFKNKASKDKMVNFWEDGHELKSKVISALHIAFSTHPREGWVRSSDISVSAQLPKTPKLKLSLPDPEGHWTKLTRGRSINSAIYFHACIENETPDIIAYDVDLVILECTSSDNTRRNFREKLPRPLPVKFQESRNKSNIGYSPSFYDLFRCREEENMLSLMLNCPCPNSFNPSITGKGSLEFTIQGIGLNARSNKIKISIKWDGVFPHEITGLENHIILTQKEIPIE